ncbi:chemotaxis protein CheD [Candidatus Methylospira mobilis]|uniref:Probable chemoreceptor glutamine deamidase CheD n=1 Tax=Candidatus Methylospira mobilis TaxID=1808979 RepID=A0A5Q0BET2_9GAMM|nr:chemotaxis protein CheD [Candidatus Methylospira mobilis]QFY42373.1 chemotaxis protein CheD [Candidatus Methylospira mobilis]WNV04529.1 chemotaxis protein CheD [Candidatus Methylospira mobilis]
MDHGRPTNPVEIFLQPGEIYFGDGSTRIRTVLGSCIALVFWHPALLLGGMCHYMLPSRAHESGRAGTALDGRYADESMALMAREMYKAATHPRDYQVKVFGGGNMFPGKRNSSVRHVGLKNVEAARELIIRHKLCCVAEHLGDVGYRNIVFDIWSGHTWVRHGRMGQVRELRRGREE